MTKDEAVPTKMKTFKVTNNQTNISWIVDEFSTVYRRAKLEQSEDFGKYTIEPAGEVDMPPQLARRLAQELREKQVTTKVDELKAEIDKVRASR